MAEIKRYQSQTVFNQPIGVVRPSRAGEIMGQAMEQVGAQMAAFGYERAVDEQTIAGRKAAMRMRTRDPVTGELMYQDVSPDLSPVAAKEAESLYQQSYLTALGEDLKARYASIALENENDPEAFDKAADTYRIANEKNIPEDFRTIAQELSFVLQSEHYNSILQTQREKQKATLERNNINNLQNTANDIESIALNESVAIYDTDFDNIRAGLDPFQNFDQIVVNARGSIDQFNNTTDFVMGGIGTKESLTKATNLKKAFSKNYVRGTIYGAFAHIDSIPINPQLDETMSQLKNDIQMNVISLAQRGAMIQDTSLESKEIVAKMRIPELFTMLDPASRKDVASDLRTAYGFAKEAQKEEKAIVNLAYHANNPATTDVSKFNEGLKKIHGFKGAMDLFGFLQKPENTIGNNPISAQIFGTNHELPQMFQDLFENDNYLFTIAANPKSLDALISMADKALYRTGASGDYFLTRGLSDDALINLNMLKTVRDLSGPIGTTRFAAMMQDPSINLQARGKEYIIASMGDDKKIDDFIDKHIPKDNPEFRAKWRQSGIRVIGAVGYDQAVKVVQETSKHYAKSNLLADDFSTLYTPERAFGEVFDMWEEEANKTLKTFGDYTLGVNAKLRFDQRSDPKMPTYYAIDTQTDAIIMNGTQPAIIRTDALKQRLKLKNIDLEMIMEKELLQSLNTERKKDARRYADPSYSDGQEPVRMEGGRIQSDTEFDFVDIAKLIERLRASNGSQ
jgi:hypothetical protein